MEPQQPPSSLKNTWAELPTACCFDCLVRSCHLLHSPSKDCNLAFQVLICGFQTLGGVITDGLSTSLTLGQVCCWPMFTAGCSEKPPVTVALFWLWPCLSCCPQGAPRLVSAGPQEQRARPGCTAGEWIQGARKQGLGVSSCSKARRLAAGPAGTQSHFRPFCGSDAVFFFSFIFISWRLITIL